jgi:hypothetical protein
MFIRCTRCSSIFHTEDMGQQLCADCTREDDAKDQRILVVLLGPLEDENEPAGSVLMNFDELCNAFEESFHEHRLRQSAAPGDLFQIP